MGSTTLVVMAAGAGRRFGGFKQLASVGPDGETIMDYTIKGALAVGFDRVVVVMRREIETALRAHFDRGWGGRLPVQFVEEPTGPGATAGTATAVLAARAVVGDVPFAVVNADDLYPPIALGRLSQWLGGRHEGHAVVGFRVEDTVLPRCGPVSRALCLCDEHGRLVQLVESTVTPCDGAFVAREQEAGSAKDRKIAADQLVSMNSWAFHPSIWADLERAVTRTHDRSGSREVGLPGVVSDLLAVTPVAVLPVLGRCVGVTWPEDLSTIREMVADLVASGQLR